MTIYRTWILRCPSCSPARELAVDERGASCGGCGGWFLDEATLLARLRQAHPERRIEELLVHNDGTVRRPCPACGKRMAIAWLELLQLDRCAAHGVWLDPGELERALAWDVVPQDLPRPRERGEEDGPSPPRAYRGDVIELLRGLRGPFRS